jgi:hypothetical protein
MKADLSSESENESPEVVKKPYNPRNRPHNPRGSVTNDTEEITVNPELIAQIKLNKTQVRQLKKLQAATTRTKPVDEAKEAAKAEAKAKKAAERAAEKAEKERIKKLLEEEAKKVAETKAKYITFKVPVYKQVKKNKVVVEAEAIQADDGDNDETEEETVVSQVKAPRRRRFQKEKVELDTSDEERVAKLESIDKALNSFAFAPRRRRFF